MSLYSRRTMMRQAMLAGAGFAVLPDVARLAAAQATGAELIPFDDIPDNFSTRRPGTTLPGQGTTGIDLRQLTSWKTAPDDIFVVTHYNVPVIDAASWRLRVEGLAG